MANKLKQFRVSINETQEEMAEKWNISLSFLKKLEGGEKNPSIKTSTTILNITVKNPMLSPF
jgi:DNA-binding XRE family transcriptional regulator